MEKVTFIATVLNEEKTIGKLLDSIKNQTIKINEIIIVDGNSSDKTVEKIKNYKELKIQLYVKKGNRAVGRNYAIERAKNEIILCSDAGCILDKNWAKELVNSFKENTDVVAGYYKGLASSIFQKCLIPYVLVMPDKINPQIFLPASRSMAFKKSVWKRLGAFPQKYNYNEDYAFAKTLQKEKRTIVFSQNAVVEWIPPDTFYKAFIMFFKFAYGDVEAGIIRPKVVLIFARYIVGLVLLFTFPLILFLFFILYCIWAIQKNFRYVKDIRALYLLPIIQHISDFAVLTGSIRGLLKRYGI